MPGNKTSKAQLRASAKWAAKNKDKKKFISYKSKAKKFISEMASEDELDWLEGLIRKRRVGNSNNR